MIPYFIAAVAFFISVTTTIAPRTKHSEYYNEGDITVSFTETVPGLEAAYTLSGISTSDYLCPDGSTISFMTNRTTGPIFYSADKRGRTAGALFLGHTPATSGCQAGGVPELACVYYSGMTLTDVTNNIAYKVADDSKIFLNGVCV